MLTEREREILDLIRQDPYQSQQELANQVGYSRSTVANLISSLVQKNYLRGRAYILEDSKSVVCIGGMNLDRKFYARERLQMGTSNPVGASLSVGGVGRNIAENLGRLEEDVLLLSLVGDDHDGEQLKALTQSYVNLKYVEKQSHHPTSSYVAILDEDGDMTLALANMTICDEMTPSWLSKYENLLLDAKGIVADLNLPKESLDYLIQLAREHGLQLAVVPVSAPKMKHLPQDLTGVEWLIVNLDESEAYLDLQLGDGVSKKDLTQAWLGHGLKQVLITDGVDTMVYAHQDGTYLELQPVKLEQVVDATGAGDALASGVIYGWLNGLAIQETLQLGLTNSYYTISSQDTVRPTLSKERLAKERKELFTNETVS
ncbi:carbohydrate kinase [Streptococcus danieliae]|uniref:Winged helix-turn-helix transcriptional regulator n=1 Tax=Streptococcus danieliae TaxID=747656 RepID=A0A7Z0M5L7_9STRE|nr:carbohydrate kinase [Streptococcus danieliae]MBF0698718.1 winged helix-turn-helix transcriptional regulator [Streptococcus danieliae]NYS95895.1 winged helix-turn-helix transcriptional regulator [Streptococcus danieliae]